jgi:hypothetical protein
MKRTMIIFIYVSGARLDITVTPTVVLWPDSL